jgi:insertion element IS1 protein InsB
LRVKSIKCGVLSNRSAHQRWLWHAIDHYSGQILADVLASHEDAALKQLKQLLAPFAIIAHFYTDG